MIFKIRISFYSMSDYLTDKRKLKKFISQILANKGFRYITIESTNVIKSRDYFIVKSFIIFITL